MKKANFGGLPRKYFDFFISLIKHAASGGINRPVSGLSHLLLRHMLDILFTTKRQFANKYSNDNLYERI
jgi:hypothetical protein